MDAQVNPPQPRLAPAKASDLLLELMDAFPNERVSVGEVLARLDGRAFGLLLLLLALPMCIPNIPGISTIFGVMMVAPALQMIIGKGKLWLPSGVAAWSFDRDNLRAAIRGSVPVLRKIESIARPRWTAFTQRPFTIVLGLQTLLLAFVLIMPIPFGNFPPGIAVALTALALLQRDGVLAILSIVVGILSIGIVYAVLRLGPTILVETGQLLDRLLAPMF
jgi:hypothetical protein